MVRFGGGDAIKGHLGLIRGDGEGEDNSVPYYVLLPIYTTHTIAAAGELIIMAVADPDDQENVVRGIEVGISAPYV